MKAEPIAAVVVASDSRSASERADMTGPAIRDCLAALGIGVVEIALVPDDLEHIRDKLVELSDREDVALILTAGGTGLAPRDVTPEATRAVLEKEAPGIPEMLRARGLEVTPNAVLSRGVAGVRSRTLIVNLPGSPRAAAESIGFLAAALPHAIETATGSAAECAGEPGPGGAP